MSIRQAGWDQISGWPHDAEGFKTWPAPGQSQTTTVTLTGAQWDLVVAALLHWATVDRRRHQVPQARFEDAFWWPAGGIAWSHPARARCASC